MSLTARQIITDFCTDKYGVHFDEYVFVTIRGITLNGDTFVWNSNEVNLWNDTVILAKQQYFKSYDGTVDPGKFYTENPLSPEGAGRIQSGIYKYMLGYHKKRPAFIQGAPIRVKRDSDHNFIWGAEDPIVTVDGSFNLHAASSLKFVDRSSAGCVVPRLLWTDPEWLTNVQGRVWNSGQRHVFVIVIEQEELSLYTGKKYA